MFASPIDVPTIRRLAEEFPRVIGIKDSSGDLAFMMRMISAVRPQRPDFTFLTGWEAVLVPMLMIGCDGGTHATSNVVPEVTRRIYDLSRAGNHAEAMKWQYRILELFDAMLYPFEFPDGFRAAAELRGFQFRPRPPAPDRRAAHRPRGPELRAAMHPGRFRTGASAGSGLRATHRQHRATTSWSKWWFEVMHELRRRGCGLNDALALIEIGGWSPAMVRARRHGKVRPRAGASDRAERRSRRLHQAARTDQAISKPQREPPRNRCNRHADAHYCARDPAPSDQARAAYQAGPDFSPLIEQATVRNRRINMSDQSSFAVGLIETQGFTAVFEAIDTALKTAAVEVLAREKLGGGYITVLIKGDVGAVRAAVEAGKAKVEGLGRLIAAHVIPSPSKGVLALLPK